MFDLTDWQVTRILYSMFFFCLGFVCCFMSKTDRVCYGSKTKTESTTPCFVHPEKQKITKKKRTSRNDPRI